MEFTFSLDQMVKVWYQTKYIINAESLEEAKKIVLEKYNDGTIHELPNEGWEPIEFSQDLLSPKDNDGKPTEMLVRLDDVGLELEVLHQNVN